MLLVCLLVCSPCGGPLCLLVCSDVLFVYNISKLCMSIKFAFKICFLVCSDLCFYSISHTEQTRRARTDKKGPYGADKKGLYGADKKGSEGQEGSVWNRQEGTQTRSTQNRTQKGDGSPKPSCLTIWHRRNNGAAFLSARYKFCIIWACLL